MATQADGTAERDAALLMVDDLHGGEAHGSRWGPTRRTIPRILSAARELRVTPHVSQNTSNRQSAIEGRTTRHPGYEISLSNRWLVEKAFGWLKQIGPLKKVKLRSLAKVNWLFVFSCAAFNL